MVTATPHEDLEAAWARANREEAKAARPPSDAEPWVVADDTGLRLTFKTEDAAQRYRNEYTDRLTNPTVTHEPAFAPEFRQVPPRVTLNSAEAEVLCLAEEYGQWMWDSGYMDTPRGEMLVDEAAFKRQEIGRAFEDALMHAYADGRKDEREALMTPTEAMIEAGKDERMECLKLPQSPPISVGEALTRVYKAMLRAA